MNVLFVNMPFASVRPAIGVSLLKGQLERMDVPSRVTYLNLRLVELLGPEIYYYVAQEAPAQALIGEWVFAPCVFERLAGNDQAYLAMVRSRFASDSGADRASGSRSGQLLQTRQIAERFLDECLESENWGAYDIVGFTTTFTQNLASLALAQGIKDRYPHVCIVFGGANCEGEMGLQLHSSFPFIDFVCSGEADISFPQLVARLRDGGDVHFIPGVISRRDGASHYVDLQPERVRNLDALPYPNYDDYFEQRRQHLFNADIPWVLMETSRGCWWGEKSHCTFCGLNGLSMSYRAKSPERALDEILTLTTRYDTPYLEMVDNILDMHYFRDLLPELKARGIALQMFYETKANLSKQQVRLLREAGVTTIQPGIESFSSHVLQLMRKGTSAAQNIQLLKWCKQYGIACNWNIIYGFPGEDVADYQEMASLVDGLHHLDPPSGWGPIRLDRFSPYFVAPERFGLCNVRPDRAYRYIYDLPDDAISNLAYYFEHDYADGRDPDTYTGGLHAAAQRWTENAGKSGLVYVDDGMTLTLQDFRVGTKRFSTELAGAERELYLFCDQNRSRQQLSAFAMQLGRSEAELETFLQRMCELRLMVAADGRYLALAVPARPAPGENDPATNEPEMAMSSDDLLELKEKLELWGETMSPRQRAYLERIMGAETLGAAPAMPSIKRED